MQSLESVPVELRDSVERFLERAGAPAIAPVMTLTLSADHRVVDGAVAAEFLGTLVAALEQPAER